MRSIVKRILFTIGAFSICLNIGFLSPIFSTKARNFIKNKIMEKERIEGPGRFFFDDYGLSDKKKKEFNKIMDGFVKNYRLRNGQIHLKRLEELELLSQPGPLDVERYRKIMAEVREIIKKNADLMANDAIVVRKKLGEDAQVFFSILLKKLSEKAMPPSPGIHGALDGPPPGGYGGWPPKKGLPN